MKYRWVRSVLALVIPLLVLTACVLQPAAARSTAARARRESAGQGANVYLVDHDNGLYKVDGRTGATIWRQPLKAALPSVYWRLYVSGDSCWVVTDQAVLAFDSRSGKPRGEADTPAGETNSDNAVAAAGTLYIRRLGASGLTLVALDGGAHARWTAQVPLIQVPMAVLGGTVYLQIKQNARQPSSGLLALDTATGAVRWQLAATPAPLPQTLVLAGRTLIGVSETVAAYPSHLMGVDVATGSLAWDVADTTGYAYHSTDPPRVVGDTVYIDNGLLLEVGGPTNAGDRTVEARDVVTGALRAQSPPAWVLLEGIGEGPLVASHLGADAQTLDVLGNDLTPAPTQTTLCAATCLQDWWAESGNRVWILNDVGKGTGELLAANVGLGQPLYQAPVARTLPPQFEFWGASGAGRLYLETVDAGGLWVQAIDLGNGRSVWARQYLAIQDPQDMYANPVVAP